ncbi:AMP-binding protein [Chitinilyticum piscinae]|uniref:AMP-binding protein n=1 Tax=Chitinilyticum piscinae TaxID=2866724 RepID=A0A8J7FY42_9NEIS|nr:AMP-binding protein [Chitinilyticum piscinae]MBE9607823.1 AMP-binding protein [Chitinilyticum piscinae]
MGWSDALHGDGVMACTPTGLVTRERFAAEVGRLAAHLREEAASDLALFATDAYWFAVGLCAGWLAGKTLHIPGDVLQLRATGCACLLGDSDLAELRIDQLASSTSAAVPALQMPDASAQLVIYTSGSTGQPKPIRKSLAQLLAEAATLERLFGAELGDALVLATVSHQHLYGLLFRIIWPLHAGRPFMCETAFFPEQLFAHTLRTTRALWVGSPAHYQRFGDSLDWAAVRPRLAALFSSAGALPPVVAGHLQQQAGLPVYEIFGSSETGGVAWRQQPGRWQALPGVELRQDDRGALALRSPHLDHMDWVVMDDAVRFAPDGGFELLGRLDRIVKIEGKRIALAGVEQALLSLSQVKDAAALALNDANRQQVAAVLVLDSAGQQALQQLGRRAYGRQLQQLLADKLEPLAIPRRWRFVAALPQNSQGKVVRAALEQLFAPPRLPELRELAQVDGKLVLQLYVPADTVYFAGHFPGHPILPGVTQIHWAAQLARAHFPLGRQFRKLENIKFQQVIRPDSEVTLTLEWDGTKQRLQFAFASGHGVHSSGRLVFADE